MLGIRLKICLFSAILKIFLSFSTIVHVSLQERSKVSEVGGGGGGVVGGFYLKLEFLINIYVTFNKYLRNNYNKASCDWLALSY